MKNVFDKRYKRYGNILNLRKQFVSFIEIILSYLSLSTEFTLSMRNISFFTFAHAFV